MYKPKKCFNKTLQKKIIWGVVALLVSLLFLFPLLWLFLSALKTDAEIFRNPPTFFPEKLTFDGFIEQLTGKYSVLISAKNSLIIAVLALSTSFLIAVPAAYGITRFKIPLRKGIIMLFLVTQMLPASVLLTPLFLMYNKLNVLNTYIAPVLSITTITIPFAILILRPMFMGCPKSLEEAARIDGCNYFTAFVRVIIPLIKPGLITVICFGFVHGWNDLVYSYTFNTESKILPMTAAIYNLMNEYGVRWNYIMAYGCILVLPPIILFIAAQKYIVGGLVSGAVKG